MTDITARALELAEEHDLHVVVVRVREPATEPRLLAEAAAETRALLDAEARPVWWVEEDERAVLLVCDGLAMDIKASLVALEDEHPLGPWWNLDLVTRMPDESFDEWHRSPMRPEPRALAPEQELRRLVEAYDWS